jgi:hypothetical protein
VDNVVLLLKLSVGCQSTRSSIWSAPRRPFQGSRYLDPKDAPRDLRRGRTPADDAPPQLLAALTEIRVR